MLVFTNITLSLTGIFIPILVNIMPIPSNVIPSPTNAFGSTFLICQLTITLKLAQIDSIPPPDWL